MEENIIRASVANRRITIQEGYVPPTAGNVDHDFLEIALDSEWASHQKRITFYSRCAEVRQDWDGVNKVKIPWEVIAESGFFAFTIVGTTDGTNRLVSYSMNPNECVKVNPNGNDQGVNPSEPSEDLLVRVERIARELEESEGARESRFNAFIGEAEASVSNAVNRANTATTAANNATASANSAAGTANTAATNANKAASDATQAAQDVEAATTNANTAASAANAAASKADRKAEMAQLAANAATSSAQRASEAMQGANAAASSANAAAASANQAESDIRAAAERGDFDGSSGVYVGLSTDTPPDNANVRINTDGDETPVVRDVQINGESKVNDGVVNIPIAKAGNAASVINGAARLANSSFVTDSQGFTYIADATTNAIDLRQTNRAITPYRLDYAVKSAMSAPVSTTAPEWSDAEKLAARERIGEADAMKLLLDLTLEEPADEIDLRNSWELANYSRYFVRVFYPSNPVGFTGVRVSIWRGTTTAQFLGYHSVQADKGNVYTALMFKVGAKNNPFYGFQAIVPGVNSWTWDSGSNMATASILYESGGNLSSGTSGVMLMKGSSGQFAPGTRIAVWAR